jgi:hydrogenase/urease accessory protein HupE
MKAALCGLAVALILCTRLALAHPAPFSYLDLHLDSAGARGALVIHDFDAAHELGLNQPESLLDTRIALQHRDTLVRIVESRLRLDADAERMAPQWEAMEVLADRQSLRLPFALSARPPGRLDLATVLFPYDANHQTFVNIYEEGRLKHQAILNAGDSTLTYYSGGAQGRWAVVRTFVQAGVHHILIGPDHILFLLALLLLGGSLWRLTTIVTAFTAGHSITLSLAALGLAQIAPSIVEPAIALSIVVVGVDNLLVGQRQRSTGTQTAARDLRPWMAGAFGLLHGFGFAAVLLEFGLPREALGWSLAAFNIGVEIGQLAIVLAMAAALMLLQRYSAELAKRCVVMGSVAVIAAGLYWFVQRVWLTSPA